MGERGSEREGKGRDMERERRGKDGGERHGERRKGERRERECEFESISDCSYDIQLASDFPGVSFQSYGEGHLLLTLAQPVLKLYTRSQ